MPFLLISDPSADSPRDAASAAIAASGVQVAADWRLAAQFGHTLAVTPPTVTADSPLKANPSLAGVSIVFDGLLANLDRLLAETGAAPGGGDDAARCVLALYQRHGDRLNQFLEGHYAGLVIDSNRRRVTAFRDRVGGRALYWHRREGLRAFASRSALIAALPAVPFHENESFIAELFAFAKPAAPGHTAFSGIRELKPGETMVSTDNGDKTRRHTFDLKQTPDAATGPECIARFKDTFDEAVGNTLGHSGNAAVMLSGGLDSPPCLASAAHRLQSTNRQVHAVSWSLPNHPEADETEWIRAIVNHLGVEADIFDGQTFLPFSGFGLDGVNPDMPLLNAYQPVVEQCYRVVAERGCSVVLNGSAGDHIYPDYRLLLTDALRRRRPALAWRQFRSLVAQTGPGNLLANPALRYFASAARSRLSGQRRRLKPPWITDEAWALLPEAQIWPPEAADHPYPAYAARLLGNATAFGRAQEAALADRFGVQRREPFQNERLYRLMLDLPVHLSFNQGQSKWIMRQAMRGLLPEAVLKKRRTGLLHSFLATGLAANRQRLHRILFEQDRQWMQYAPAELVREALHNPDAPDRHRVVMSIAASYSLWRQFWTAR